MASSGAELQKEISRLIADFLARQLGERADSVETFLSGNTVTVRATNCFAPAEQILVQDENDWRLFQQFKNQQFEGVKLLLKKRLEQITDCEVLDMVSVIGQDGIRFKVVTLNKTLKN